MNKHELNNEYVEWIKDLVSRSKKERLSYTKLFNFLYHTEFIYVIGMDGNRYEDGVNLRYRFGYEKNIDSPVIADFLDDKPCSVLEMLAALSLRCEEHIMANPDSEDQTGRWFWEMIKNLDLYLMTDSNFDKNIAIRTIERFLYREYDRDGKGGLFKIPNCPYDLRSVEIWYQLMWYLNWLMQNET